MNLTQLKYFSTICSLGSFSAAALHLHVSQPSLSACIKDLEAGYGVTLFRRHHRGVVPTPEGEALNLLAQDILRRVERCERELEEMGKGRSLLRLGVPPMIGSMILPSIYTSFSPQHPSLSLLLTEGSRQDLLEGLEKDELDLVFLPHSGPVDGKYQSLSVQKLSLVCCAGKASPLCGKSTVSPEDLKGVPLVLFEDSFFQTGLVKRWFSQRGVTPHIMLQTKQLSTVQLALKKGLAVGFLFQSLVDRGGDTVPIPTDRELSCQVSLVLKKERRKTEGMMAFLSFVQNTPLFPTE